MWSARPPMIVMLLVISCGEATSLTATQDAKYEIPPSKESSSATQASNRSAEADRPHGTWRIATTSKTLRPCVGHRQNGGHQPTTCRCTQSFLSVIQHVHAHVQRPEWPTRLPSFPSPLQTPSPSARRSPIMRRRQRGISAMEGVFVVVS